MVPWIIVFSSGFCSLVYEVLWERMLRVLVGGGPIISAVITGTFLLGIGLGAWLCGRTWHHPFRVYAMIEMGIGLFALLSYPLLDSLQALTAAIPTSNNLSSLLPFRVGIAILYLIIPSLLIGARAPVMFQCFAGQDQTGGRRIAVVYFVDLLGAACGILAVPFAFLNQFSLLTTILITASFNLFVAGSLMILSQRQGSRTEPVADDNPGPVRMRLTPSALVFLSGFIALSYQICLMRSVSHMLPGSAYAFPITLFLFLLSMSGGSWLVARLPFGSVPSLLLCASLAIPLGVLAAPHLPIPGMALALQLLVPFFIGGIFPLVLRNMATDIRWLPILAGRITAINGCGCFLGAVCTQFGSIPQWGTVGTLKGLCVLSVLMTIVLARHQPRRLVTGGAGLLALILVFAVPASDWTRFAFGQPVDEGIEGVTGTASITWEAPNKGDLLVNGVYMAALPNHLRHIEHCVLLAALQHRENVLLLGLGGANVLHTLLQGPDVHHITVVEWSSELTRILETPRAVEQMGHPLLDPRVTLIALDARFAARSLDRGRYDLIFDNLSWGDWVGATEVKSREYYEEIAPLLNAGGVFVDAGNYSPYRSPATGASQYEANMAAIQLVFPHVHEHSFSHVTLASFSPVPLSTQRVERSIAAFAGTSINSNATWYLENLQTPALPPGTAPLRDGDLFYEYNSNIMKNWKALLISHEDS